MIQMEKLHLYSDCLLLWFIIQGTNEIELTHRGQLAKYSSLLKTEPDTSPTQRALSLVLD